VRTSLILCAVLAVFGCVGCAENRQYFRPTEHVRGETARGEREAIYQLVGPFGPFGEAKVWSRGAFRAHGETLLFAAIELHNTSGVPILVDPQHIRVSPVRVGRSLLHDFAPVQRQVLSVAPGAFGVVKLHFVLPSDISPGQVSSFGLRWQVQNGPQSYAQRTPFLETRSHDAYAAYPPPYARVGYGYYGYYGGCSWGDPLCRGPYGYGVGMSPALVAPPPPPRPPREVIRVR